MGKIKYKFLNYQTYQAFLDDLNNQKILDDSIVFIQDVRRIWARGAEYSCNTQVLIEGNTITLLDSDGNIETAVDFISLETIDNIVERLETLKDNLKDNIDAEAENRQINESIILGRINSLQDDLDSEVNARTTADSSILDTLSAEIQDAITNESAARNAGDTAITDFITNRIIPTIKDEIDNRKLEAVADAIYEDTKIKFRNKTGAVISQIDASAFIKDGMVDSVSIIDHEGNKALKLVFNTDAGKDPMIINIGDIFELNDYYTKLQVYTKTEIDNKDASLQNAIDNEIYHARNAENTISNNLSSESSRATLAEQTLTANLNKEITDRINDVKAEHDRAVEAETELDTKINIEKSSLSAAINKEVIDRSDAVNSERQRAEGVEESLRNTISNIVNNNPDGVINKFNEIVDFLNNISDDETTLEGIVNSINSNISDEASTRSNADQNLQQQINTISGTLSSKQNSLTAGEGINLDNNVISVKDYISESDINDKLRTLQQMLGELYVLKEDVYDPERDDWSQAPVYPFGDIAVSGGSSAVNRNDIYALDQHSFDVLVQNNQVRNDVCYLITD